VSYRSQLEFVERVKAHNLPITHVTATATDKESHGLFAHGHQLADNCAHDAWEAEEVERAWAVSKDTTTIAVLEEFVRRYGDSHYAALARARMEELGKSQAEAAPPLVPPQPSVAAIIVPKRVKTVTIRTEVASRPTQGASSGALTASTNAQTRVQSFERTALSDARTSVQTYYSLTPDCNQGAAITVRVQKQPSQGTLEIARDRGFTNYAADNIRAKCNAQEVELTRVWYKSNADFKGRDQAQLEAFFTSGTSIKTTLQITVK
jgi:hypothetical protein